MKAYKEVTLSPSEPGIWVVRTIGERGQNMAPAWFWFHFVEMAGGWPFFTTGAQGASDMRNHIGSSSLSLLVVGLLASSALLKSLLVFHRHHRILSWVHMYTYIVNFHHFHLPHHSFSSLFLFCRNSFSQQASPLLLFFFVTFFFNNSGCPHEHMWGLFTVAQAT